MRKTDKVNNFALIKLVFRVFLYYLQRKFSSTYICFHEEWNKDEEILEYSNIFGCCLPNFTLPILNPLKFTIFFTFTFWIKVWIGLEKIISCYILQSINFALEIIADAWFISTENKSNVPVLPPLGITKRK